MIDSDADLTTVLLLIVSLGIVGLILLNATIGALCGYLMPGISVLEPVRRGALLRGRVRRGNVLFVARNGEFAVRGVVVSHTYSAGRYWDLPALPSAEERADS